MIKVFENLYQGNLEDVKQCLKNKNVDFIVYLGQGLNKSVTFKSKLPIIHIPLNDGENNDEKIDMTLLNIALIETYNKVLVACRQGVSRSVAICAAYLYIYKKGNFPKNYDDCLSCVQMITKTTNKPNEELIKSIKCAITKHWGE